MVLVSDNARISGNDITEKAQRLWVAMREDAVKRRIPQVMTRYGAGYYLLGTVQSYVTRLWGSNSPDLRLIRAFLKASSNVVVVEQRKQGGRSESKIFVRNDWNPALAVPVAGGGGRRDAIDERARKLTPEEAGETRPEAPVQVTKLPEKKSSPYVGPIPETIDLGNGTLRCGACGYETTSTTSMGSHKRKHYHERARAMVASPPAATPTPSAPVTAVSEVPLAEALRRAATLVEQAEQTERAAEEFLTENVQLNEKVSSLEGTVTELQSEVTRLQTENQSLVNEIRLTLAAPQADPAVVERLSRAESLIELIRGVVARYTEAKAGPVRTLTDIEDLLAK